MKSGKPFERRQNLMTQNTFEVSATELKWTCDPQTFEFETTAELPSLSGFIGQERAIKAIEFGLGMNSPGYNIYVAGLTGTGKTTIIKSHLEKAVEKKSLAEDQCKMAGDWCYINNFEDADRPIVLQLPRGQGKIFRAEMEDLIKNVKGELSRVFESEEYVLQRKQILEESQKKQRQLFQELERKANDQNFTIQSSPMGMMVIPVRDGKPMTPEEYLALEQTEREELEQRRTDLMSRLSDSMKHIQAFEREARKNVKELDDKVGQFAVEPLLQTMEEQYQQFSKVLSYLNAVKINILKDLEIFKPRGEVQQTPEGKIQGSEQSFTEYKANVIVDNTETKGQPIIIETNPTYANMFGRIEKRSVFGTYITDFTMIKAGSISRANGGYLVVNALDVLINPGVWEALKRTLKNKEVRIEDLAEQMGLFTTAGLKPQSIPTEITVVMIGNAFIYHLLYNTDEDFKRIFKVKADFDSQISRNGESMGDYAAFIASCCQQERLKPFDRSGVAKVMEYGARLVGYQNKLSTRFSDVIDIIREAHYWAQQAGSDVVSAEHIAQTIEEKVYRSNLIEERIQELIEEETILVDVTGMVEGQVNGLAIYDLGDFSFGKPSRITARTFMGRSGVINIERESKLSGRLHDKGILILGGYLGYRYAQDKPLTLSASICFEQSYEGVDGDSASSTELYAILSSLSGLPIKQNIAVTGSVDQKGRIQPIGGGNQKTEGFFDVCKAKGLTRDQGVIIPKQNTKNLMLREDVVSAVEQGEFHIYAVETIDQGIEILTGIPAGIQQKDGSYPEDTVSYLVDKRLRELGKGLKEFSADEGKKNDNESEESCS